MSNHQPLRQRAGRRRCITALAAGLLGVAGLPLAHAQDRAAAYPNRPIRLVLPITAGSATDGVGRFIATQLNKAWGTAVIVDNKPGAGVIVGTEIVAKAAPDGYTLLLTYASHWSQPWTMPVPYDAIQDFIPVVQVATTRQIMAVRADSPFRTVADVIAAARANPGKLSYGSAGIGTTGHMAGAMFTQMANVKIDHVPYKGAAQVPVDAASGQVDMMFGGGASALALVKSGRLRLLGTSGSSRMAIWPDVPTIAEAGLPGYENDSSIFIAAPRGTPMEIVNKISDTVMRLLSTPEFKEYCITITADPDLKPASRVIAEAASESAKWKRMIDLIKPEGK